MIQFSYILFPTGILYFQVTKFKKMPDEIAKTSIRASAHFHCHLTIPVSNIVKILNKNKKLECYAGC